jgi:hypothetical protein
MRRSSNRQSTNFEKRAVMESSVAALSILLLTLFTDQPFSFHP